jgi:D-glycero-D-manno-heptose 1,7-bisphosphate phosphatase
MLDELDGAVSAIYYCPHEEGTCDCRKPRTGMFVRAARQFPGIELRRSAVIGDSPADVEAARAVGALAVLIGRSGDADADITAASLADAVALLLD